MTSFLTSGDFCQSVTLLAAGIIIGMPIGMAIMIRLTIRRREIGPRSFIGFRKLRPITHLHCDRRKTPNTVRL